MALSSKTPLPPLPSVSLKGDAQFPFGMKWVLIFIGVHWLAWVLSLMLGAPGLNAFFSAPLIFPNIKELWASYFPGSAAHFMVLLNSILAGGFFWFLVWLVKKDTDDARRKELVTRWPSILGICLSVFAILVIGMVVGMLVIAPKEDAGEPMVAFPLRNAASISMMSLLIGGFANLLTARKKIRMKWHRPFLYVAFFLTVYVISVLVFKHPASL